MSKPLAIDLFCGLGGWTEGLLSEGYEVIGYDIEAHEYDGERYPATLVLQDVLTLDGAQFADAALIVASPPCQEFSYMAMPWTRAKQIGRALRGQGDFPAPYSGSRTMGELTALFDACFRIQREASAAAGQHVPLVVENVRGAEPWLGRAQWNFGSYYLWGDVPALMPPARVLKTLRHPNKRDGHAHTKHLTNAREHCICPTECDCEAPDAGRVSNECPIHNDNPYPVEDCGAHEPVRDGRKNPGFRFDGSGKSFQSESVNRQSVGSRKAAAARIAKIPLPLSSWIARTYRPALTHRSAA